MNNIDVNSFLNTLGKIIDISCLAYLILGIIRGLIYTWFVETFRFLGLILGILATFFLTTPISNWLAKKYGFTEPMLTTGFVATVLFLGLYFGLTWIAMLIQKSSKEEIKTSERIFGSFISVFNSAIIIFLIVFPFAFVPNINSKVLKIYSPITKYILPAIQAKAKNINISLFNNNFSSTKEVKIKNNPLSFNNDNNNKVKTNNNTQKNNNLSTTNLIKTIQTISNNPKALEKLNNDKNFQKLLNNPKIKGILQDKNFMEKIKTNPMAVIFDPATASKLKDLLTDPEIRETFSKIDFSKILNSTNHDNNVKSNDNSKNIKAYLIGN